MTFNKVIQALINLKLMLFKHIFFVRIRSIDNFLLSEYSYHLNGKYFAYFWNMILYIYLCQKKETSNKLGLLLFPNNIRSSYFGSKNRVQLGLACPSLNWAWHNSVPACFVLKIKESIYIAIFNVTTYSFFHP